jgi:hypothetical protein
MPQFDKITFLNQIIWLFLFFSGTYFVVLKLFLPRLAFVLKLREKKLLKGLEVLENCPIEINNSKLSLNKFWFTSISTFKEIHLFFKTNFNIWLTNQNLINFKFLEKKILMFFYFQLYLKSLLNIMTLNKQFNYTFNFLQKIKFSELNVIDFSKSVKKKNSRKKKK